MGVIQERKESNKTYSLAMKWKKFSCIDDSATLRINYFIAEILRAAAA